MTDVRAKARAFYNALDFDRPINFGQVDLVRADRAKPASLYVEGLHGGGSTPDAVVELADQIDFSESAGAYLFTGNRGTGKTTELMRLAQRLPAFSSDAALPSLSGWPPTTPPAPRNSAT